MNEKSRYEYMAMMVSNSEFYNDFELYIEAHRINANQADQLLWSITG